MPFKNEARYLAKTLESILAQTEKEFELIAVDDHSDDHSFEIVNSFASSDNRIKLFKNCGNGTISGLQTAFTHATGELISRHDADDLMPNDKLHELKTLLVKHGKGYVSTGLVEYFSDDTLAQGFINYADWLNNLCKTNTHENELFKECVIASPNWMMFRDDLISIGEFSDAIYPEDYHLVFKIFEQNLKVVSSDKITHYWRDHSERASRTLEHYKDQKFFSLKVDFFIKFYGKNSICLWGTGPSGKKLAKELISRDIDFHWVTNSERKIGETIYGVKVHHFNSLKDKINERLIISVTQKGSKKDIFAYLNDISFQYFYEF